MANKVERFTEGDPYPGAARLNEIVDNINVGAFVKVPGASVSNSSGNRGIGTKTQPTWLCKVAQSWSSGDVTTDSPAVNFFTCKVQIVDPSAETYADGQPDDLKVYDPAGYGRLLPQDTLLYATPNPTSGRWEVAETIVTGQLGKTDSAISKNSSGTVSVYAGTPGSESDSSLNITVYNKFADVASGKFVWCHHNGNGWYLTAAECS